MYLKLGEPKDKTRLVELLYNFHQNTLYKEMSFSVEKVNSLIETSLKEDKNKTIVICLMDSSDIIQGVVIGTVSESIFNTDKCAMEMVWWVEPEFRGHRESIQLIKAYKNWGLRVGCSVIQMCSLSNSPKNVDAVYKHLGLQPVETTYVMEVK